MGALKYIFVFLSFGLFGLQSDQDETISWQADKKLSWKDFKGKAPLNARAAATTASGISYEFSTSGTVTNMEVDFKIDTYFYPEKSWYQAELCDDHILNHEQLHFDISELFARKMKKRLSKETFTHKNIKSKVRSIYKETLKNLNDFQNLYDQETNFSRNTEQQLLWEQKIADALNK